MTATLGQHYESQMSEDAKAKEAAHHTAAVLIWTLAKKTAKPLEAQALLYTDFQDYTGDADAPDHLSKCQDWIASHQS